MNCFHFLLHFNLGPYTKGAAKPGARAETFAAMFKNRRAIMYGGYCHKVRRCRLNR
jgi:hypothetical protein